MRPSPKIRARPRPQRKPVIILPNVIPLRISTHSAEIKEVANQIVAAEQRFNALPVSAQVSARSLIDEVRKKTSYPPLND